MQNCLPPTPSPPFFSGWFKRRGALPSAMRSCLHVTLAAGPGRFVVSYATYSSTHLPSLTLCADDPNSPGCLRAAAARVPSPMAALCSAVRQVASLHGCIFRVLREAMQECLMDCEAMLPPSWQRKCGYNRKVAGLGRRSSWSWGQGEGVGCR